MQHHLHIILLYIIWNYVWRSERKCQRWRIFNTAYIHIKRCKRGEILKRDVYTWKEQPSFDIFPNARFFLPIYKRYMRKNEMLLWLMTDGLRFQVKFIWWFSGQYILMIRWFFNIIIIYYNGLKLCTDNNKLKSFDLYIRMQYAIIIMY